MGDGRAEGLLAIGDGGQAAISLMPDMIGQEHLSLQIEGLYVEDLLYLVTKTNLLSYRSECQKSLTGLMRLKLDIFRAMFLSGAWGCGYRMGTLVFFLAEHQGPLSVPRGCP